MQVGRSASRLGAEAGSGRTAACAQAWGRGEVFHKSTGPLVLELVEEGDGDAEPLEEVDMGGELAGHDEAGGPELLPAAERMESGDETSDVGQHGRLRKVERHVQPRRVEVGPGGEAVVEARVRPEELGGLVARASSEGVALEDGAEEMALALVPQSEGAVRVTAAGELVDLAFVVDVDEDASDAVAREGLAGPPGPGTWATLPSTRPPRRPGLFASWRKKVSVDPGGTHARAVGAVRTAAW